MTAGALAVPTFNIVNRHNLAVLSLVIGHSLSRAHHIAIDTEFTGLGDQRKTREQNIEDRYKALADVARSHALVAFGLSVFEKAPPSASSAAPASASAAFLVHNFQFVMLSRREHAVDPSSLSFLVEHGFDFNDQIQNGIPYMPGNDIKAERTADSNILMRSMFGQILASRVPVVVHNGLLDAMFLYQSFYADLPKDLTTFISDLHGMFPGGLYDTKYVSEFVTRESRTFLSYLFRKYERAQQRRKEAGGETAYLDITIQDRVKHSSIKTMLSLADMGLAPNMSKNRKILDTGKAYCEQYAAHGVCHSGKLCTRSHDLDLILDHEEAEAAAGKSGKSKGKKRKAAAAAATAAAADTGTGDADGQGAHAADEADAIDTALHAKRVSVAATPAASTAVAPSAAPAPATPASAAISNLFETYHSACFDAYMTGFIFAHQCLAHPETTAEHGNRLYLIGKSIPLRIEKSLYARTSDEHERKRKVLKLP
ncbi:ribonuclease CAF1 [Entophlyctis helioformis]|nr:ribonuclease CAF1 [Entophlyctis helioformis]